MKYLLNCKDLMDNEDEYAASFGNNPATGPVGTVWVHSIDNAVTDPSSIFVHVRLEQVVMLYARKEVTAS